MERYLKEIAKELKLIRRELEKSNKAQSINVEVEGAENPMESLRKSILRSIEENQRSHF